MTEIKKIKFDVNFGSKTKLDINAKKEENELRIKLIKKQSRIQGAGRVPQHLVVPQQCSLLSAGIVNKEKVFFYILFICNLIV
jgi:hypothetical protein